jgi:hypothetical protein
VVQRVEDHDSLTYESCAVFDGVPMTGGGEYRADGTTLLEPVFEDSDLRIEVDAGGTVHVTGTFRGDPVVSG